MKRNKKSISIILVLVLTMLIGTVVEAAPNYKTYKNHKMIGGVGNYGKNKRYYYVVGGSYASTIAKSIDDWVYTTSRLNYTTSLSFKKTTTRKNSVVDFMTTTNKGTHPTTVLGWTEWYVSGKAVKPENKDWKYCYVKIYTPQFKKLASKHQKGTISHEFGHAFGLAHNQDNKNSIMCQYGEGRKVTTPRVCDLKGIKYLYK